MKKLFLALLLMPCLFNQEIFAIEKRVGSYSVNGTEFGIFAELNDEDLVVGIEIVSIEPKTNTYPIMKIKGKYNLLDFRVVLKFAMEKMIDMTQRAKDAGIYDHTSIIDPGEYTEAIVEIHWKGSDGIDFSSTSAEIPFFYNLKMGEPMIMSAGKASHWADDSITLSWGLGFTSPREIQVLIDALDEKRILSQLKNSL